MLLLPLLARAEETKEEQIEAKAVPAKVMEAFKKDFPGLDVSKVEIEKETYQDGTVHYGFEWKNDQGKEQEAEYNADGERLEEHDDDADDADEKDDD
jgi:uncharacterized membrane protein YkoI